VCHGERKQTEEHTGEGFISEKRGSKGEAVRYKKQHQTAKISEHLADSREELMKFPDQATWFLLDSF
jgi:hypothetical protein